MAKLRAIRLYYFFTGTSGFLIPFLSLFYVERGLTGTQIGWLGTIGSLTALVVAPLWGRWRGKKKRGSGASAGGGRWAGHCLAC